MNVCALLALGISLMPPAVSAASSPSTSIDCKLAKTAVERTICADPELASLDAGLEHFQLNPDRILRQRSSWHIPGA